MRSGPTPRRESRRSERPERDVHRVDLVPERHRCQAHRHADDPTVEDGHLLPALAETDQRAAGKVAAAYTDDSQHTPQKLSWYRHQLEFATKRSANSPTIAVL